MVSVYLTSCAIASSDIGGSRFCCELKTSWNAPELYMNLESPGVVDTSVVQDILGLRALYEDAEPSRVLSGKAQNSV